MLNEKDPDLSTLPECIKKSSSQIQSNFRCNVRKIYQLIRESDRVEVFIVDKNIGLGIRAKRVIFPNTELPELTELGGRRLIHAKNAKHPSAVQTSKGKKKVDDHILHGTLAFVNHHEDSVKKEEEITTFYSYNALPCRLCPINKAII